MGHRLQTLGIKTRTLMPPNVSVAVSAVIELVTEVARALPDFDSRIAELRPRFEADAHSGTAPTLG